MSAGLFRALVAASLAILALHACEESYDSGRLGDAVAYLSR